MGQAIYSKTQSDSRIGERKKKKTKKKKMKVATKVVFLLRDSEGFSSTLIHSLHPNPNSSLRSIEEPFELSLETYGIKDQKASGNIIHYVDHLGNYQVSVLFMQNYEPPVLACAVKEVLSQITGVESSLTPTLLVPYVLASSKLKCERKTLTTKESKVSVYGIQIGPETDITQAMVTSIQKAPSSLQIHHEPLACLLQLVRVLKLPTFVLLGQSGQRLSDKALGEDLEILYEIGELLASATSLCFSRDRIVWRPTNKSKDTEEPWRALYG